LITPNIPPTTPVEEFTFPLFSQLKTLAESLVNSPIMPPVLPPSDEMSPELVQLFTVDEYSEAIPQMPPAIDVSPACIAPVLRQYSTIAPKFSPMIPPALPLSATISPLLEQFFTSIGECE
jgi:hypothetical protein